MLFAEFVPKLGNTVCLWLTKLQKNVGSSLLSKCGRHWTPTEAKQFQSPALCDRSNGDRYIP